MKNNIQTSFELYEKRKDPFYRFTMYAILFDIDEDFDISEAIKLGNKLVDFFTKKHINFRTFYVTEGDKRFDPEPDEEYLIFLLNQDIVDVYGIKFDAFIETTDEAEKEDLLEKLTPKKVEFSDIPENIELARIPNNDIEIYITANKYNM